MVAGGAIVVRVHAQPGACRSEIAGVHGDALKVRVRAAAEKGRANRAVEALLADLFGVPPAAVTVRSGVTGRAKRVQVDGIDAGEAARRLQAIVDPA